MRKKSPKPKKLPAQKATKKKLANVEGGLSEKHKGGPCKKISSKEKNEKIN